STATVGAATRALRDTATGATASLGEMAHGPTPSLTYLANTSQRTARGVTASVGGVVGPLTGPVGGLLGPVAPPASAAPMTAPTAGVGGFDSRRLGLILAGGLSRPPAVEQGFDTPAGAAGRSADTAAGGTARPTPVST